MDRAICKILILFLFAALSGCKKDKPDEHNTLPATPGNIYVVCEGNFGNGNGTLYSINNARDSAFGDLFAAANSQPLGDVFQSMQRIGDNFFLCINNSDKIIVANAATLKAVATIRIPKPRYILPVSATRAYVSSLYSNKVYIINTQLLQLADSILLPYKNTEGMCLCNGSAIICTWDTAGNKVYLADPATDKITQAVTIPGYAPQAAMVDREQMLWVLSGNRTLGRQAALTRLDPSTGLVLATYTFPAAADPLRPVWNATKDTLYFIEANYYGGADNNGIYRMGIHDEALPAQPFVAAGQYQYFWALGVEPATGHIFVGDPKGFIQRGNVTVYRPDGTKVSSFSTGLGPGSFYFGG